jgi:hypothetical protein
MKTLLLVSLIAVAAIPALNAAGEAQRDIATTLQQSRKALGATALKPGSVLSIAGTVTVNGLKGTGRAAAEIGGTRLAEHLSTPPLAAGHGYDGTAFWNQDQSGLVWTDGSDAGVSREIDIAYAAGDTLFTPGSGGAVVAWGGVQSAGGRRYAILIVTPRRSRLPMRVWIDAASHLPARYVIPIGPVNYERDVSEYREVDGLLVPHRVVSNDEEGNSSSLTVRAARLVPTSEGQLSRPVSQVADFTIKGGSARTSVPFQLIDRHIYLNVRLNGKGPYRFVFDTGGSNLVDPAVAKAINAVTSGSAQDSGTGAGTESYSYTTIDSLQIGNAALRHQVFSVEPIRKGFGVDGLIGFDVLARYVTTFDYATRTVTLAMPHAGRTSRGQSLRFVLWGTLPQVGCSIDGIASECTVDTGDAGSVQFFVPFVAAHPKVVPAKHSAVGVNGYGIGGGHRGFMGRLSSLQLGAFTLHDLVAGYSTQNKGDLAFPFLAANVGGGVWQRFTVTFDYGASKMTLQPNANFARRDTFDRSGMVVIDKTGKVVVYSVRRGTPAAQARFASGDVIRAIDGLRARSASQVRRALRGAPGTVLHVEVSDKTGTVRTITLTLRDWV